MRWFVLLLLLLLCLPPASVYGQKKEDAQAAADAAAKRYTETLDKHKAAIDEHNKLVIQIKDQDKRYKAVRGKMNPDDKEKADVYLTVMDKAQAAQYEILKIALNGKPDGELVKKIKKGKGLIDEATDLFNNGQYLKSSTKFIEASVFELGPAGKMADKSAGEIKKARTTYGDILLEPILKKYENMQEMSQLPITPTLSSPITLYWRNCQCVVSA